MTPAIGDDHAPSWLAAPAARTSRRERREESGPVPPALAAALVVTIGVAAAEAVHVAGRDELVPGFRAFLLLVVASQVALAVRTARRSAGAALGLLVCQVTTVVASLAGGEGLLRVGLAVAAVVVVALVCSALGTFPSPELPPMARDR